MNLAQILHARWAATPALENIFPARQVITGSYFAVDPGSRFATITLPRGRIESYANDGSAVNVLVVRVRLCHDDYQQGWATAEALRAAFDGSVFELAGADKVVSMQQAVPPQEAQDPHNGRWTWTVDFECRVANSLPRGLTGRVACKELAGSPRETYAATDIKAQRHLLCAWEDRQALVGQLLGSAGDAPRSGYPGQSAVLAVQVQVQPFEARPDDQGQFDSVAAQLNSYSGQFAHLTVDYALSATTGLPALPPAAPGTYFTYQLRSASERVPVAAPTANPAPTVRLPAVEHHLTWHRVAQPPWELIRAGLGCVNQATFLGALPGTVLFDGLTADPEFLGFDAENQAGFGWRLTCVFKERPQAALQVGLGWNPPSEGSLPLNLGGDTTFYPAADFAAIFV